MSEYKAFNMSIEASLDKTRVPSQESIMPAAQMETDALDLPIGDCKEVLAVENCNGNWKIDKCFQSMDEVTSFSSGNGESQKPHYWRMKLSADLVKVDYHLFKEE